MYLQCQFLTNQEVLDLIVNKAIQIYRYDELTDDEGILIETAVYRAVHFCKPAIISNVLIEQAMSIARSELWTYKE